MVTIGDYANCPQCSRLGYIVWVSPNGDTVGIMLSIGIHCLGVAKWRYGWNTVFCESPARRLYWPVWIFTKNI